MTKRATCRCGWSRSSAGEGVGRARGHPHSPARGGLKRRRYFAARQTEPPCSEGGHHVPVREAHGRNMIAEAACSRSSLSKNPFGELGGPKPSNCHPNPATCAAGSEALRSKASLHVSPAAPQAQGKRVLATKAGAAGPFRQAERTALPSVLRVCPAESACACEKHSPAPAARTVRPRTRRVFDSARRKIRLWKPESGVETSRGCMLPGCMLYFASEKEE